MRGAVENQQSVPGLFAATVVTQTLVRTESAYLRVALSQNSTFYCREEEAPAAKLFSYRQNAEAAKAEALPRGTYIHNPTEVIFANKPLCWFCKALTPYICCSGGQLYLAHLRSTAPQPQDHYSQTACCKSYIQWNLSSSSNGCVLSAHPTVVQGALRHVQPHCHSAGYALSGPFGQQASSMQSTAQ